MPGVKQLTRSQVIQAAARFKNTRKVQKWTAIVEGRELPARPLVLMAAGVPPNDPTNSHQAVKILEDLGFETRYVEDAGSQATPSMPSSPPAGFIADLAGEIRSQVPAKEWRRLPRDLATNLDHYLYGSLKREK